MHLILKLAILVLIVRLLETKPYCLIAATVDTGQLPHEESSCEYAWYDALQH